MPLVCTIELDKTKGITVEVDNGDGKITQTIVMDGTNITLKIVKQGEDACTIEQTPEEVTITCKRFTVNASETIQCTSQKASTYTSEDTLDIKSTKDMTLTSSAKLVEKATSDVEVTGATIKQTAQSGGFTVSASAGDAKIDAMSIKLTGSTGAELTSPKTKVNGDGTLDLDSGGIATLKGSLTNVQGNLVNLG